MAKMAKKKVKEEASKAKANHEAMVVETKKLKALLGKSKAKAVAKKKKRMEVESSIED